MDYYLDANGTDGADLAQVDLIYQDGTRIAANDLSAIAAKDAADAALLTRVQQVGASGNLSVDALRDVVAALAELAGIKLI